MYYIQDADYEEALKNGISRKLMWLRVNRLLWSIDRAKTKKVRVYQKKNQ